MAVTTQTVNNIAVVQVGADGDSYEDLRTTVNGTTHATAIADLPQATQIINPLYFPAGVGATFDSPFLILSQRSGIFVHDVDPSVTANRTGLLIRRGTLIINTDVDNRPPGVGAQRPSIARKNGTISWQSVHKTLISPLQFEDSTMVFCTDENAGTNKNNAIVLSRVHRSSLIRDPNAVGDLRLFLGGALDFDDVRIVDWSSVTFNDVPETIGQRQFNNVRVIGNTLLNIQGMTDIDKMRFEGNSLAQKILWYAGNVPANRRVCAIFNNMDFLISAANDFSDFSMISHPNLNGTIRPFTNSYDVRATDVMGNGLEGISVVGFCRRTTDAELSLETALDINVRYIGYGYPSDRYGPADSYVQAGTLIRQRLESNFSLPGQDELVTDAAGVTVVPGETGVTRPRFRSIHQIVTQEASSWGRTTFTGHVFRYSGYGFLAQDIPVPVRYDTIANPDDLQVVASMVADSRITQATRGTVAAYNAITTLSQVYDYIRNLEFLARKNPHMVQITADQKTIVFPAGSSFAVNASQSAPISVTYAAGVSPVYTFRDPSVIGADGNFDGINLGNAGNAGAATFDGSVGVADQSGVPVRISTIPAEALLRVEAYEGDTLQETVTGTSGSDGTFLRSYVDGRSLRIYSKKYGYFFKRLDFQVDRVGSVTVELGSRPHINTSLDISGYLVEADASLTNKIYFDFGQPKSYFRCGAINTTGQLRLTQALIDNRISTQEGLEFFAYYNTRTNTEQYHNGQPFLADADRIEINEDYLDFAVIPTQNTGNIVRLGTPVYEKDETTAHVAPLILGRRVAFDNLQFVVPAETLAGIAAAVWKIPLSGLDTVDSVGEHVAALTSGGGGGGGGPSAVEIREEIDANSTIVPKLDEVRAKTGLLNAVGDDIKATLDGERVSTDDTSREASKADVGTIQAAMTAVQNSVSAIQTTTANTRTVVNAIQTIVNQLRFTGNDLHATLDGEEVATDAASRVTGFATSAALQAVATDVLLARKILSNSYRIVGSTLEIQDDDNATVIDRYSLLGTNPVGSGGRTRQ